MSDHLIPLYDSVLAAPEDPAPQGVLADYLEETGHPAAARWRWWLTRGDKLRQAMNDPIVNAYGYPVVAAAAARSQSVREVLRVPLGVVAVMYCVVNRNMLPAAYRWHAGWTPAAWRAHMLAMCVGRVLRWCGVPYLLPLLAPLSPLVSSRPFDYATEVPAGASVIYVTLRGLQQNSLPGQLCFLVNGSAADTRTQFYNRVVRLMTTLAPNDYPPEALHDTA